MKKADKEFITECCLKLERNLIECLQNEIHGLARAINNTVEVLATKEALAGLQKQMDDLKRS